MACSLVDRLSDPVLLLIIVHVCASAPPQTPGICWVTPVCRRWRQLAAQVKGLRVLFQGQQDAETTSFAAWISRHAPQVTALASLSWWEAPLGPLRALAHAATTAAAAGRPLPLQRLVVQNGYTLEHPEFCHSTLAPLFSSLPQLQHLHLSLWASDSVAWQDDTGHIAAVAALGPLRHLTALTSLYLYGPSDPAEDYCDYSDWDTEIMSCFPSSLERLEWHEPHECDINDFRFDWLTRLTELRLVTTCHGAVAPSVCGYTQLPRLRKLQLEGFKLTDAWLLEHKEVIQGLGFACDAEQVPGCLGQLANLRTLDLRNYLEPVVIQAALAAAPEVTQLHLPLPAERDSAAAATTAATAAENATAEDAAAAAEAADAPDGRDAARAWLPSVMAMTGLRLLTLEVPSSSSFLPVGLGALSQLTRLHARFSPATPGVTCAWVCALEQLVNLQVLTVPAVTVACHHRWLTGLTQLGVVELVECSLPPPEGRYIGHNVVFNLKAAAAHLQCLTTTAEGATTAGSPSIAPPPAAGAAAAAAADGAPTVSRPSTSRRQQLQLVCVNAEGYTGRSLHDRHMSPLSRHLRRHLAADVALFAGSLGRFLKCGWCLWPQPTAARLQQLLGDMV